MRIKNSGSVKTKEKISLFTSSFLHRSAATSHFSESRYNNHDDLSRIKWSIAIYENGLLDNIKTLICFF